MNVWQSFHPSLTAIQIRDGYMAVCPPRTAYHHVHYTNFDTLFLMMGFICLIDDIYMYSIPPFSDEGQWNASPC